MGRGSGSHIACGEGGRSKGVYRWAVSQDRAMRDASAKTADCCAPAMDNSDEWYCTFGEIRGSEGGSPEDAPAQERPSRQPRQAESAGNCEACGRSGPQRTSRMFRRGVPAARPERECISEVRFSPRGGSAVDEHVHQLVSRRATAPRDQMGPEGETGVEAGGRRADARKRRH